ncbi:axotactin isoform X2 [Lycorma delicatula]|uniref:axotactin isoform X2 n=1 Tax=Lycorma delicatula TaxID=130591 RepID=UPI003F519642
MIAWRWNLLTQVVVLLKLLWMHSTFAFSTVNISALTVPTATLSPRDTLPPYLLPAETFEKNTEKMQPYRVTTIPSVPASERGIELTFPETGRHKVFMMAKSNAFIQLDGNRIPTFQLRLCREISFQFRTKLPHGLLVYHSVKDRPEGLDPYALYVIVEKGQLKVVHVFGKQSTSVIVGEGLNRDTWHSVMVRIDVHGARLIAKVDDKTADSSILGLHPSTNYGVTTDLTSVVLIGGLSPEEKLHGVKYIIESFVGCIKDMVLSAGKAASDLLPIKPLIATKHDNVQEGCINKCRTRENLCFVGSMCINHYNQLSCDCFGTRYEGELCDIYTATILTLRGSSYVSYRVYDWKDRVHSSVNRISLHFKTMFNDSVLFYASGESPNHHHIAVSLVNGSVVVDVDLGGGKIVSKLGENVTSNDWHNLTILHKYDELFLSLDDDAKLLDVIGSQHHLYIDPEIYIGGGPELSKKKGLLSHNNFVGSLKYVFYNDVSILYELKKSNPKVHYIGVLDPTFDEQDVDVIPFTFPFPTAHFSWNINNPDFLTLSFDFKSSRNLAVLATSEVTFLTGIGYWEVHLVNEEIRFELIIEGSKNFTHLTTVKYENIGTWHHMQLNYSNGELKLKVDNKYKEANLPSTLRFKLAEKIIIGSGISSRASHGLVGCMRDIIINGEELEPRYIVRTKHTVGQVSLDNCQLVDPCKRPNACEHGGKCSVKEDKLTCDCKGTGYIGKNCHFAKFRKTCEELALLGYTKPDVYLIDIDGNGRFPPAHVKCEFQSLEDSTKTIVEHNLPSQVDVRSAAEKDFSFTITYREFSSEMLQELISHSLYCSQYIKYDCYKAPLELHSATWFISAAQNGTVDYVGNVKRGSCPCAENRTCVNPDLSCNCDVSEAKWLSDEGYYISPNSLGITQMVFLQQKDLEEDALGRITLGPLECVETNTQKYVVTFTTSQSYIEVPGWRKGDIAFSFRTTGEKAILLYQPPIRPHHPSFMVALTSDFLLTFNFTLNTGKPRELEIKSQRRLNSGEWQKIWIDYNKHHVRFMINTDYQMVDLLPEEEFGPFEGSMFIGGATEDLLVERSVHQGLIGCFRGLVVNGEILDIYSYMSVHLSEIIKDCKPSCDPNPCKNGAKCKELWSTFQCVCDNPWAYIGKYCETNINEIGMTLVTPESFFKKNYLFNSSSEEKNAFKGLLNETILINLRTYDDHSLILHANDHLNNFIQLFINNGKYVIALFNSGDVIKNISVRYPGLNSGKSVQVALVRKPDETILHVNERNNSVIANISLLTEYSNKPWNNSEKEVLAPQRPPAPPTEYFQVNLGGYDPENLLSADENSRPLEGYVGCIQGLKIGDHLIDLPSHIAAASKEDVTGIIAGCNMKCDQMPCKNQGICIEDFQKGESSCNCEKTSYYGEFCGQEKGADFSGESVLNRKYPLHGTVNQIKVQMAFSTSDDRQQNTAILLIQTENSKSYYLIVALSNEGELIFEEDREGSAYGVRIKDRYFLNGARHSIYYKRTNDSAVLLIDREHVALEQVPVLSWVPDGTDGSNVVQIGGLNSSDRRFAAYKNYSGCLSNVFLEINHYNMKPLDEYMLFTKSGEETTVMNSQGIRSAQCAFFDVTHKPRPGPSLNISGAKEQQAWVEDPPAKIAYKSLYSDPSMEEEGTGRVLFIIALSVFCTVILGTLYHVYRNHLQYKKRKEQETEAAILWHNGQQVQFQDPVLGPTIKVVRSRSDDAMKSVFTNGSDLKPLNKGEYKALSTSPPTTVVRFRTVDHDLAKANGIRENGIEKELEVLDGKEESIRIVLEKVDELTLDDTIKEEEEEDVEAEEQEKEEEAEIENNPPEEEENDVDEEAVEEIAEDNEKTDKTENRVKDDNRLSNDKDVDKHIRQDKNRNELMQPSRNIQEGSQRKIGKTSNRIKFPLPKMMSLSSILPTAPRKFANPISYLGGPRLNSTTQGSSKESILSVD